MVQLQCSRASYESITIQLLDRCQSNLIFNSFFPWSFLPRRNCLSTYNCLIKPVMMYNWTRTRSGTNRFQKDFLPNILSNSCLVVPCPAGTAANCPMAPSQRRPVGRVASLSQPPVGVPAVGALRRKTPPIQGSCQYLPLSDISDIPPVNVEILTAPPAAVIARTPAPTRLQSTSSTVRARPPWWRAVWTVRRRRAGSGGRTRSSTVITTPSQYVIPGSGYGSVRPCLPTPGGPGTPQSLSLFPSREKTCLNCWGSMNHLIYWTPARRLMPRRLPFRISYPARLIRNCSI